MPTMIGASKYYCDVVADTMLSVIMTLQQISFR